MSMLIGSQAGSNRCAVCGTFIRAGVVCPEHRVGLSAIDGLPAPGARRTTEWLPLEALSVPRSSYQREERPHLVRRIVREFDPDLLGLLTVCRDQGGELWILDGQHRWLALVELGYEQALCEVLHDVPLTRQAEIFSGRNSRRIAPHPRDAFRADHVAREPGAVAIVAILARHGYQPPYGGHRSSANRFVCVATLRDVHGWGLLEPTVAVLREAWPADDMATQAPILAGLAGFLRLHPEVGRRELVARLVKHSATEVLRLARARQANSRDRRLWAHVAATLVELYNRGRREVHRLPWAEVPFDTVRQWKERQAARPEEGL
jgi:Family of unknown function (DUF6551)